MLKDAAPHPHEQRAARPTHRGQMAEPVINPVFLERYPAIHRVASARTAAERDRLHSENDQEAGRDEQINIHRITSPKNLTGPSESAATSSRPNCDQSEARSVKRPGEDLHSAKKSDASVEHAGSSNEERGCGRRVAARGSDGNTYPAQAARTTISLANSIPVARNSRLQIKHRAGIHATHSENFTPTKISKRDAQKLSAGFPRTHAETALPFRQFRPGIGLQSPESGTAAQLIKVFVEAREIIAVVGIAHDDVAAASGLDPAKERAAIAANGRVHRPRAMPHDDIHRDPSVLPLSETRTSTGHAFPGRGTLALFGCMPRSSQPH